MQGLDDYLLLYVMVFVYLQLKFPPQHFDIQHPIRHCWQNGGGEYMRNLYKNKWFSVVEMADRIWVAEPGNPAVAILTWGSHLLFVRIDRRLHGLSMELPRGGSEGDESAIETAARELLEETGYRVQPEHARVIGHLVPNSGRDASKVSVVEFDFSTCNAEFTGKTDGECLGCYWINRYEIQSMIRDGLITCGITLSALNVWLSKTAH